MSRLAKRIIEVPQGVSVEISDGFVLVKGSLGENRVDVPRVIEVVNEEGGVRVRSRGELKKRDRALVGTIFRLIQNAVLGSSQGFSKRLEVSGVGFKVAVSGQTLTMSLGFSHPVVFTVPNGMKVGVEKNLISILGPNKQQVGQIAAELRNLRKPEPYKGTGIKYVDEIIRRKAGKQVKAAGAG